MGKQNDLELFYLENLLNNYPEGKDIYCLTKRQTPLEKIFSRGT
jgi:hypothetical protein